MSIITEIKKEIFTYKLLIKVFCYKKILKYLKFDKKRKGLDKFLSRPSSNYSIFLLKAVSTSE